MANDLQTWTPPEAKVMRTGVNVAIWAGIGIGIVFLINHFGMSIAQAEMIVGQIAAEGLVGMLKIAGCAVVGYLLFETFWPGGKINKLYTQAYNSIFVKASYALLQIDPLTPLYEKRKEMNQRKAEFDEADQQFSGFISNMKEKEAQYRTKAEDSHRRAAAAMTLKGHTQEECLQMARDQATDAGKFIKQADDFAAMRKRLEPIQVTIGRMRVATNSVIHDLDTDISNAKDKWAAQQTLSTINRTARGILKKTSSEELAGQAMELINTRYSETLGRLENLSDVTKPFLDSIDLDNASYSEAMLVQWQNEAAQVISATNGTPVALTSPAATLAIPQSTTGSFGSLIH